jgi:DNA-binding NarL/FixJ family response regulator
MNRLTELPKIPLAPYEAQSSEVLLVSLDEGLPAYAAPLLAAGHRVRGPYPDTKVRGVVASGRTFGAAIIDVDGSEASYDVVWQLAELEAPCRSVLIGSTIDRATVREAFLVGVVACLAKPVDPSALVCAVRNALEGTRIARECLEAGPDLGRRPRREAARGLDRLTPREQEVLELVLDGRSTRNMADELGVSERTIKFHVANVLAKLGAKSRLSLLAKLRSELALD